MTWEVLEISEGIVHVVPTANEIKHLLTPDCICGPRTARDDLTLRVTHHALDGREHHEPDHDRANCPICSNEL